MHKSIWESVTLPSYPSLNENMTTEVLIIGGGICGVLCAYFLSKKHKVILVEAGKIANSRTNKTTAVITALQDINYRDIQKMYGSSATKLYLNANLMAIEEYEKLSKLFDFDFERVTSYKYFKNQPKNLKKEIETLHKIGYYPRVEDGFAIGFDNQGQMNPLKLIQNLIQKLEIYENTKVIDIKNQTAYTDKYQINAKHIIVATGYPFLKWKGLFFLKLYQKKSYVAAISNISKTKDFNAIGSQPEDLYFRTYQNHLLVGCGDQRTGKTRFGFIPILRYLKNNYTEYPITYQWKNQDCVSLDGLPYIGKYFKNQNVYVATGFNLWGMTGAMIAASILTDKIEERKNPYAALFSPHRPMVVVPLIQNIVSALTHFILPKKRCTHLGCALQYNDEDGTYECPCHGTKYTKDGKILFNPAIQEKKL